MKISNGVNKKISFPIAFIVIIICAILVSFLTVCYLFKFESSLWNPRPLVIPSSSSKFNFSSKEISSEENRTKDFLGSLENLNNIKIRLSDIHGLWGGRNISILGSGSTFIEIVGPKPQEIGYVLYVKEYHLLLEESEVKNLIDLFIENDFLTIEEPVRKVVLHDETKPAIILKNSKKEQHVVSMWHTDIEKNERFARIYQAIFAIEKKTKNLTPFFESKFSFSCNELEREIKSWLGEINYCETDSDCVAEQRYYCPFGCYQFYNKNADLTEIDQKVKIFKGNNCYHCEYVCMTPPTLDELKCINKKCVDIRYQK